MNLQGLLQVWGIYCQSISEYIVDHMKSLPKLKDTLLLANPDHVLEYEEAMSFVLKKVHKTLPWRVMCCKTRQIIAFVIDNR